MEDTKIQKLIDKRIKNYHIGEIPCENIDPKCEVLMDMDSSFGIEKLKDFCFVLIKDILDYKKSSEKIEEIEEEIIN